MATADVTRLMNMIRMRVPAVLDNVIQLELFETLDEFFTNTNVWREDIPISIIPNQTEYELIPTGVAVIHRLMWVSDPNNLPVKAYMDVPGCLLLDQPVTSLPTNPYIYTATVALKCEDPTDNQGYPMFPDWILSKYRDNFLDGVVGRLMSQPAKPYSNQQLGVYHLRRWRNAMANVRSEVQRRNKFGAQGWMYPQQFRVTARRGTGGGGFGGIV